MSSPKIHNKAKVKINGRLTEFARQRTYITSEYIASLKTSSCSVSQACHVVLNASIEGCLTTDELERAIRSRYPGKGFQRNTLIQKLSQSGDFAQVFLDGKTPGRWFLTGQTGSEKNATNDFFPDVFERQHTDITFVSLAPLNPAEISVWKACHAILNSSFEGCLTTDELEVAIRFHYPEKDFQRNSLSYTLSQSEDFARVFPGRKTPSRWYLTGEAKGVERANVNGRAPKHAAQGSGASPTSDSDHGRDIHPDSPLIPEAPFATNPDSHTGGSQSPLISRGIQSFEVIGQNRNTDFKSQPDLGRNIGSVRSWDYAGDEFLCMLDGPHENILSHEPVERQVSLPTERSSPTMLATQEPTPSLPSKLSGPEGPDVAHQDGLVPNTSGLPNTVRPYEGTMERSYMGPPLLEDCVPESVSLKLMACGTTIAQHLLPLAYHTMCCWTCSQTCPEDDRRLYHSLVSADGIPFELPWRPVTANEQPGAGAEIPTAGVHFGGLLGLFQMDMDPSI